MTKENSISLLKVVLIVACILIFIIYRFVNQEPKKIIEDKEYIDNIELYEKKCECSNSWEQQFIYYYSMSFMLLYIILIVGMLFASLFNNRLV